MTLMLQDAVQAMEAAESGDVEVAASNDVTVDVQSEEATETPVEVNTGCQRYTQSAFKF